MAEGLELLCFAPSFWAEGQQCVTAMLQRFEEIFNSSEGGPEGVDLGAAGFFGTQELRRHVGVLPSAGCRLLRSFFAGPGILAMQSSMACQEVKGNELRLVPCPECSWFLSKRRADRVDQASLQVELITRPDIVCLDEPRQPHILPLMIDGRYCLEDSTCSLVNVVFLVHGSRVLYLSCY